MHTVGFLLHFLTRLVRHKCVFFKDSERLKAVIRALRSGKFYRLPPDKENPAVHGPIQGGANVSKDSLCPLHEYILKSK